MYKVDGTTITMTRGDTVTIQIEMKRGSETYTPQEGDVIRFAAKKPMLNMSRTEYVDPVPLVRKTIPNDTLILSIQPNDTKALAFGEYVYDIELTYANGNVDTFIAEARLIIAPEVE